jgi:polar amino acid transport system substrate-binding protein
VVPLAITCRVISGGRQIVLRPAADLLGGGARPVRSDARVTVISFSSEYYRSEQHVLVRADSSVRSMGDLTGRTVCAAEGSTTLDDGRKVPGVMAVAAEAPSDCLVRFQRAEVDAISSDETVLHGLAAQDPYARVVGPGFAAQPYGLGIARGHPDFVRFVNGVLDEVRRSGRWRQLYSAWLARDLPDATVPAPDHSRPLP